MFNDSWPREGIYRGQYYIVWDGSNQERRENKWRA